MRFTFVILLVLTSIGVIVDIASTDWFANMNASLQQAICQGETKT